MSLGMLESLGCDNQSITKISNFIEFYSNPNNVNKFILKNSYGNPITDKGPYLQRNFYNNMSQFKGLLQKFVEREKDMSGEACRNTTMVRLKAIASELSTMGPDGQGSIVNYSDFLRLQNAIKTLQSFTSRNGNWLSAPQQLYQVERQGGKRKSRKNKRKSHKRRKTHKKRRTYK
jgi:hypothetical protein